jgi:hypothetical protein
MGNRDAIFNKLVSLHRISLFLGGSMEKYINERDPNGVNQHDAGAKLDAGKPDCSLLNYFGLALLEVSKVGTFGAEKYTRGGWQHVDNGINRYTAAMIRHWLQEKYNEYDSDLPVLHAAQVAWNALARLELILREKEKQYGETTSVETGDD